MLIFYNKYGKINNKLLIYKVENKKVFNIK